MTVIDLDPSALSNQPTPEQVAALRTTLRVVPTEVATNADKLALTDVAVGRDVLIIGEANRLEKYMGPIGGEEEASVTVSGFTGDFARLNGIYLIQSRAPGETHNYHHIDGTAVALNGTIYGRWTLVDDEVIVGGAAQAALITDWPWEPTAYEVMNGATGTPVVTRNDIASDVNWEIIGVNTFELFVRGRDLPPATMLWVAGVERQALTYNAVLVSVGWVKAGSQIRIQSPEYTAAWHLEGTTLAQNGSGVQVYFPVGNVVFQSYGGISFSPDLQVLLLNGSRRGYLNILFNTNYV